MGAWVSSRVEEQRVFGIYCPAEGCRNELFEQDVRRLVDSKVLPGAVCERLAELRSRDYTARAHEFTDSLHKRLMDLRQAGGGGGARNLTQALEATSQELAYWMKAPCRLCPRCHVMLQKSQGCNSFTCICGHRFDYEKAPSPCGLSFDELALLKKVIRWSEKGASFRDAELQVQAWSGNASALEHFRKGRAERKAARVAALLGVSLEDAGQILSEAEAGNQAAWARISQARQKFGSAGDEVAVPAKV